MVKRVILNSSGNLEFCKGKISSHPLTLKAITSFTGLHVCCAAGEHRPLFNQRQEDVTLFVPVSLQTFSEGGEGSLSGPQQYVAVQRLALPLQKGTMYGSHCKYKGHLALMNVKGIFPVRSTSWFLMEH